MPSIITNLTVATAGRIVNTALGLIATAILARLLGSANYGIYSILLSYGVMFQIVADFGLYLLLTQKIGQDAAIKESVIPPIFTARLGLLAVAFIISAAVAVFLPATSAYLPALGCILAGLACQSVSQLCMGIFQANRSVAAATLGDTVGRVAQIAGLGLLLFRQASSSAQVGLPVVAAALVFAIGTIVALGIHMFYLPDRRHFSITFSLVHVVRVLKESWPLGAMLILNTIYFRIDMVMLTFWRGAAEIGWYALAYRLIENALFFPAMVGGLLLPQLSAAFYRRQNTHAQKLITEALQVVATVAAVTAVVFITAPREIVGLIAGQEFLPAAPLLQVLTLALVVMFFGNIFGFTLVAQKENKFLLKLYCILVAVNIGVNFITIPALGALGAALSTLLTEIIACGVAAYKITTSLPLMFSPLFRRSLVLYGITAATLAYALPREVTGIYRLVVVGASALALAYLVRLLRLRDIPLLLHTHPVAAPSKPSDA